MVFLSKIKQLFIYKVYGSKYVALNQFGSRILFENQQHKLNRISNFQASNQNYSFHINESIPRLSWIAIIDESSTEIIKGRDVEQNNFGLIEGIWDKDFSSDFTESDFVFGSGIKTSGDQLVFVPPKHCSESLFFLYDKSNDKGYVSNSMCFCLEAAQVDEIAEKELLVGLDNSREHGLSQGIDLYDSTIFESSNYRLQRFVYYNFSIGKKGSVKLHWSKPREYFNDYNSYYSFLNSKVNQLLANATSQQRAIQFPPITTISRGYDSPAAAVIAKNNGCKEALTLDVSVFDLNDCGLEIGKKLDMKTKVFRHILHDDIADLNVETPKELKNIAYQFIATVGIGDDITFYPMRDALRNRTLLSGVYGDFIWEKDTAVLPGLPKRGIFGKSITEFRLDSGYFHIPTACLGARFSAPLQKICQSKEMEKYSIGGDYDRPIPRRICEDAGIAREQFGVAKCATAPNLLDHHSLFFEAISETRKRYRQ